MKKGCFIALAAAGILVLTFLSPGARVRKLTVGKVTLIGCMDCPSLAVYETMESERYYEASLFNRLPLREKKTFCLDGRSVEGECWKSLKGSCFQADVDVFNVTGEDGKLVEVSISCTSGEIVGVEPTSLPYTPPEKRLSEDECRIKAYEYLGQLVEDPGDYLLKEEWSGGGIRNYVFHRLENGIETISYVRLRILFDGSQHGYWKYAPYAFDRIPELRVDSGEADKRIMAELERLYQNAAGYERLDTVDSRYLVRLSQDLYAFKYTVTSVLRDKSTGETAYQDRAEFLCYLD